MFLKVAVAELVVLTASALDTAANGLILYAAAAAAATWFLVKAATVIRLTIGALRKLHASAEVFAQLPEWMASIEAEVGVAQGQVGQVREDVAQLQNGQSALLRDLGIPSDQIRRVAPSSPDVPTAA